MTIKIKVLDPQTVNEIAAGEVIERPASVVKELMENSIDAGARHIEVRVNEAGKRLIEVIDDGEGMNEEDALLSIRQHATSKIARIDDISSLSTYGFRGEALASIASVSRITIITRQFDEEKGTEISKEFGSEPKISPIGSPPGTTIAVENLFANIPARKKHLAKDKTELTHIISTVTKYAVAHPEISFDLFSDDSLLRSYRGPDSESRLMELLGPRAFKSLVEISAQSEGIILSGALTRMEVSRSSSSSIFLFVNHRPIQSSAIISAIADGYGTRSMRGRYPVGYLMLDIPPGEIDVNVHPTKREVRFSDPDRIAELVLHAIDRSFQKKDLTPTIGDLMDFMKIGRETETPRGIAIERTFQTRIEAENATKPSASLPFEPLFQLFNNYIVAAGAEEDAVIIIDQHAAAERVTYENILHSIEDGEKKSQELLTQSVLELTASERSALEENLDRLSSLGFDIEPFGGGAYRLRSVPVVLGKEQGEKALRELIDDISKEGRKRDLGEEIIWKVACHGSIRAGQQLALSEMRVLISDLLQTSNPYTCEHGRPTMISLKIGDLERLFKRKI